MNCPNIFKCYLSIFIALSLTPQPKVLAQSNATQCKANLYSLSSVESPNTLELKAIDIMDANGFVSGNSIVEQQAGNPEQPLPAVSPYKSSVTKNIQKYWQMRVKSSDIINANDVKYRLRSTFEPDNPFKATKLTAKPLGNIEQIENCADETIVISGGVSFEFKELSTLVPGRFTGQIDVCVPVNGTQCS